MDAINFIKEVETKYNVKSIKVRGTELWPFLRTSYFFAYYNKYAFSTEQQVKSSLWVKIKRVKNIFYGFLNLFKKYDYLVFSSGPISRVKMNNKLYDKYCDGIYGYYNPKILFIESWSKPAHYEKNQIATKRIISGDLLLFLSKLFFTKDIYIENGKIIREIEEEFRIHLNYKKQVKSFLQCVKLLDFFLKIYKPQKIFLSCYYSIFHQALIYVAHKYNIKVVEIQHGIINKAHPAYNVFTNLDKSFFPDYLFVFGDYVKGVFDENNYFIKRDNILAVGSMYMDYINNEYEPLKETVQMFSDFRKKYKKIVAISSQWVVEDKLIDFLKKSVSLSKDILYIFVPRDVNKDYSSASFPDNIIILKDLNVYQIVKEVDIHSTLQSTCALEAPVLGVPNVLINIDNFAKKCYLNILTNQDVTRFVDTEEEFVNMILSWDTKTKEEIMSLHSNFYKKNYEKNLKQALQIIESAIRPDYE